MSGGQHAPGPAHPCSTQPRQRRGAARWWREDRGSVSTELTLITPVLILLLVFIAVVIHRGVEARLRIESAAHQAARAASLQRSAPAATIVARTSATDALSTAGVGCRSLNVETDTADFRPGGTVTVTLGCALDLGDAIPFGVADRTVEAAATEPIDLFRSLSVPGGSGPP